MWLLVAFVSGAVAALGSAWWKRRTAHERPALSDRLFGAVRTAGATVDVTAKSLSDALVPSRDALLASHLRLVRDALHADAVLVWQRASARAPFVCVASADSVRCDPATWGTLQHRELARWSADEGMVSVDAGAEPRFVAAPVRWPQSATAPAPEAPALLLVASLPSESVWTRDTLKAMVQAQAAHTGALWALWEHDTEMTAQNRELRALVRTALEVQATSEPAERERNLVERAVEATGADFAVLVQWDRTQHTGTVRRVTAQHPLPAPAVGEMVTVDSIIARACIDGTPQLWDNAQSVARANRVYGGPREISAGASLAVIPMRRGAHSLGAVVLGSNARDAMPLRDLRTAGLFAQLAASGLEAAWELEEVSRESQTDALTGLWNRRRFNDEVVRVLNETDRFGGQCALVLVDVDHFKAVNDNYGHECGDAVLKVVSQALLEHLRSTDMCARIGGEEIGIVLPQTGRDGALELAERLRLAVAAGVLPWRGGAVRVTASFGVALYEAGSGEARRKRHFALADAALYAAKRDGRNRVECASG